MGNKTDYKVIKPKQGNEITFQIKGKVDIFQPPMEREVESLISKMKPKKGDEPSEVVIDCSQLMLKNTDTTNLLIYFLEEFINNKLRRNGISCSRIVADNSFGKILSQKGLERLIDIRLENSGSV